MHFIVSRCSDFVVDALVHLVEDFPVFLSRGKDGCSNAPLALGGQRLAKFEMPDWLGC